MRDNHYLKNRNENSIFVSIVNKEFLARWQRGYAADCNSVYTSSTLVRASNFFLDKRSTQVHKSARKVFPNSSAVEQLTVNQLVGGSNPSWGAIFPLSGKLQRNTKPKC